MRIRLMVAALTLGLATLPAIAANAPKPVRIPDAAVAQATKLREQALSSDLAYRITESLTTEVGPRLAGSEGDALNDLAHVFRNDQLVAIAGSPGLLGGDRDSFIHGRGVVRANFRTDTVLERRDDLSACGVVFGIGRKHERNVERQADRVSLNLNVTFLHDVEKPNLNLSRQVRQFVHRKNAAIGARQQSVMDGQFA